MMIYSVEKTKQTPVIRLDPVEGKFWIEGESYPEDAFTFYEPMFNWLNEYFSEGEVKKTTCEIKLKYFNSSSSKVLFDIFDLLDEKVRGGFDIEVLWICEKGDEACIEYGEDFLEDLDQLSFRIVFVERE